MDFLNDRAKFTAPYYSMEELVENPPQTDVYITGSDQVWNSSFLPGEKVDEPFYLGFTKKEKKYHMPPVSVKLLFQIRILRKFHHI